MGLEEEQHTRFLIFCFDPHDNQIQMNEKADSLTQRSNLEHCMSFINGHLNMEINLCHLILDL